MIATIPIANIYHLLCYAWDHLDEAEIVDVHAEDETDLLDLFARVLCNGTSHLLRRGIDRGYITQKEVIPAVKGKLLVSETVKRSLLMSARTFCSFDDFTEDVLHNRILRATLDRLARIVEIDGDLREEARAHVQRLSGVTAISVRSEDFRRVQLHRNNAFYDFLIKVCRLLFDHLFVEEHTGATRFRDFLRDERRMRRLFEDFVRVFYKKKQSHYRVSRPTIDWFGMDRTQPDSSLLPRMETDVVLESRARTLIIDTKFTSRGLDTHFDRERARSGHLYQLFAYIKNLAPGTQGRVDGMLLYPVVEDPFAAEWTLDRHTMSIQSIDLRKHWRDVEADLLRIIGLTGRHANAFARAI